MITKVLSIYRVDTQKHDHHQTKDGAKKKEQEQFKEFLAKALTGTNEKDKCY